MIEMMVAIVILGLGLLMAATMFPVGWTRARDLAEFTTETSTAENAATTVRLLCDVSNPLATPPVLTSFLGDFQPTVVAQVPPDPFVHVLHIENALADRSALPDPADFIIDEWYLHDTDDFTERGQAIESPNLDWALSDWWQAYESGSPSVLPPMAQIAFHERVVPPLPPLPPPGDPERERWEELLNSRRFAWAVLHRIGNLVSIQDPAVDPRSMTLYLVTLRRTQLNNRFARQNPAGTTTAPLALGPEEDMVFPVPWLINLEVLGAWDSGTGEALEGLTGLPSEAVANSGATDDGRLIARMLQTDSVLIDRLTGSVYTVTNHRFTGDGENLDKEATVTLDREITVRDVDTNGDGQADVLSAAPSEVRRDFWVFPPPVAAERPSGQDGFVFFDGRQPVVGIEVRQMFFSP